MDEFNGGGKSNGQIAPPVQAVLSKLSAQRTTVKAAIALLSQEGSVIAFCDDARGGSL